MLRGAAAFSTLKAYVYSILKRCSAPIIYVANSQNADLGAAHRNIIKLITDYHSDNFQSPPMPPAPPNQCQYAAP